MKHQFRINNRIAKTFAKKLTSVCLVAGMALGLTACGAGEDNDSSSNDKLQIVTTIFPEYDWVREIVGQGQSSVDTSPADSVEVSMLLDKGTDLHSYQPTAADIAKISTCDVFIYVGGESDAWVDDALKEALNKDMVVIDLMEVLGDSVKEEELVEGMECEEENEENEASEEDASETDEEEPQDGEGHHHDDRDIEYDEHIWLSIRNAETLTEKIAETLETKDTVNATAYKANADAYIEKLSALDAEYQSAVDAKTVDTILFGDRFPFRYMVDDYGINYYAAFVGCSAETEASFETIIFLSGKVNELKLPAICTIEKGEQDIAKTVRDNTDSKDQEILTLNSLQSVTPADIEAGTSYLQIMTDNLSVLKKALGVSE